MEAHDQGPEEASHQDEIQEVGIDGVPERLDEVDGRVRLEGRDLFPNRERKGQRIVGSPDGDVQKPDIGLGEWKIEPLRVPLGVHGPALRPEGRTSEEARCPLIRGRRSPRA